MDERPEAEPLEKDDGGADTNGGVSRRGFLRGLSGSLAATALGGGLLAAQRDGEAAPQAGGAPDPQGGGAPDAVAGGARRRRAPVERPRSVDRSAAERP